MKNFIGKLKSIDKFGLPIGVNYQGKDKFKTLLGVAATLLSVLIIVNFSIYKTIEMVTRDSQSTSDKKTYINLEDAESVKLSEGNI